MSNDDSSRTILIVVGVIIALFVIGKCVHDQREEAEIEGFLKGMEWQKTGDVINP